MISKEIIQILQKYSKTNSYTIKQINSNLQNIIEELLNLRYDLYRLLKQSIDDNKFSDDLCADITLLNKEIENIKLLFIMPDDIEQPVSEEVDNDIPPIDFYSVIVLSNTYKCSSNHNTKDLIGKIPVLNKQGVLTYKKVNISYCFDCEQFTMLKSDYLLIKDHIMCQVIDKTEEYLTSSRNNYNGWNQQSKINQYGYNVNSQRNLSSQQRQTILASLIEADIVKRNIIINHIEWMIQTNEKRPTHKQAIQKWKEDVEFVKNYKIGNLSNVIIEQLILKYKKSNS